LLVQLRRLAEAQRLVTEEEKPRIEDLQRKIQLLINGGSVGTRRTKP